MVPGENVNYSRGISEHTYEEKRTVQPYYSWLTGLPTTEGGHDHRTPSFKKLRCWYQLIGRILIGHILMFI